MDVCVLSKLHLRIGKEVQMSTTMTVLVPPKWPEVNLIGKRLNRFVRENIFRIRNYWQEEEKQIGNILKQLYQLRAELLGQNAERELQLIMERSKLVLVSANVEDAGTKAAMSNLLQGDTTLKVCGWCRWGIGPLMGTARHPVKCLLLLEKEQSFNMLCGLTVLAKCEKQFAHKMMLRLCDVQLLLQWQREKKVIAILKKVDKMC